MVMYHFIHIPRGFIAFQASGVTVQSPCVEAFNDIKIGHKFRYIVYSLTPDLRQIRVLKTAPPSIIIFFYYLTEIYRLILMQ